MFYAEIHDGRQKWQENHFWQKVPDDLAYNEIALTRIISKSMADGSGYTLWDKYFVEIILSDTVSEINLYLHFNQNFSGVLVV